MNPINKIWQTLSRFYHRLGSPKEFYRLSEPLTPVFGVLFLILCSVGSYQALVMAPADYQQGDAYRILFVHVPNAWMSMFVYVVMAIAGAIALVWRMKMAFMVVVCSAPIGATFTALALFTGAIWGKPIWGTYWQWDARLTSELILLFLYLGVIALHNSFEDRRTGDNAAALLSLVGVVIVPIIHYSVEWWSTLHQGATVFVAGGPRMPPEMLTPLVFMVFGFMFFYGYCLFLKLRNRVLETERQKRWVTKLIQTIP